MDIQAIYAVRNTPRPSVSEEVRDLISKLKISFKPAFRRPFHNHKRRANVEEQANWRESALIDVVRKVREKDDADSMKSMRTSINLAKQPIQNL